MWKKIEILSVLLAAAAATLPADNNIVKTLKVTPAEGGSAFAVAKTGYVQVSGVHSPELTFTAADGGRRTVKVRENRAVIRLTPGRYTVNAADVSVKKIGENNFYSMVGNFTSDDMAKVTSDRRSGRYGMFLYNWKYLRENILDPFTTLTLGSAYAPEIAEWRAEGRLIFRNAFVTVPPDAPRGLPLWNKLGDDDCVDGIGPDEFIVPAGRKDPDDASLGYTRPGHGFSEAHLQGIRDWLKKHPGKFFYTWLGIPWNGDCLAVKPLYDAVTSSPNGAILWEAYVNAKAGDEKMQTCYVTRGTLFKQASGGSLENYIIAPATYEYMDNNGAMDFKVHLDRQFHLMATDPLFDNLRGFGMWAAYYTEPEILRWFARLVRHYGVDGETTMLSEKYGYKLYPGILKAPNWENDKDWSLAGGAAPVPKKDTVLKQGYIPYTTQNFLRMEIGSGKHPSACQTLRNLEPGKLYRVKTLFCTPEHPEKSDIPVDLKLDNAEIVESELRYLQDFTRRSPHVWNVRKVVFRAGNDPVKLTLAEKEGAAAPAVVLVDMVQAAPYFSE